MDDLLGEFLTETGESLEVVDSELVRFEREPNNSEILDNVFRLVHTIKGTCGFLGLPRLEMLAHAAETLMGTYRDGAEVTGSGVSTILNSIDRIKMILGELEENGEEPLGDDQDLIDPLLVLAGVKTAQQESEETSQGTNGAESDVHSDEPDLEPEVQEEAAIKDAGPADNDEQSDLLTNDLGGPMGRALKPGEVSLADLDAAFAAAEGPDLSSQVEEKPKATQKKKKSERPAASQTIRVNVQTIETLMNMVSELVLTRNQLLEISRRHEDSEFNAPLQRLSNVTAELQEGVMQTRMQPIGNAWGKLPRIVRDLSLELGRPIDLEMVGAETELDRQVLELIRDPLTHMVRNSADHGIEPPEVRQKMGKPKAGKITVSAFHEGGHIIIDIADDGKGLNTAKLREKALEKGIVSEAELAEMNDVQVNKLIFHAGFSTAEKVTSVSGRGVGMDVVRTNIELIGGSIDLHSVEGQGTSVKIKIPLTLAIIPALIIEAGGERFAIPQLAVTELVRAHPAGPNSIEKIKDAEVLRLREALLPVIRLTNLLKMASRKIPEQTFQEGEPGQEEGQDQGPAQQSEQNKNPGRSAESSFVVVTRVGSQEFGIIVDEVFHTEEIVVKPMSGMLKDVGIFSGNTIMGDGSVILIVDPNGVAQAVGSARSEEKTSEKEEQKEDGQSGEVNSLLLFEAGSTDPKAVPLSLVTRLEEFDIDAVERAGERHLVQYRGRLMPLVYVDKKTAQRSEGRLPMLVFSEGERSMGLVVDRIVDIVSNPLELQVEAGEEGFLGSAIVAGKATEILDVGYYLPKAFSDWFGRKERKSEKQTRILYAEDSQFFRDMIVPVLKGAGFAVTVCEDGIEAYQRVQNEEEFDLVVSDIEMPNMDGFTLARLLKDNEKTRDWPFIALSSFTGPQAEAKARQLDMFAYVAKFDRRGLLDALKKIDAQVDVEIAA
ncbi:Signal transduction histidine kinase CheA / CheY-like domain [hydrothermal vent metagenome]|uniref:histidine kinase n=1 Tax=hydrothermal vent metagenome TaxID=652676 RepID=A0A3B0TMS9_9ZZZZ